MKRGIFILFLLKNLRMSNERDGAYLQSGTCFGLQCVIR